MSNYKNDNDFEDRTVTSVDNGGMTLDTGWSFGLPEGIPVKVGSLVRFWPGETHNFKRGLMVDGVLAYYRTEEEDKDYRENDLYGKDAAEWVARWDAGKSIFSISMGGLGPGYEQCIQIVAVECVRAMLAIGETWWDATKEENDAQWKSIRERVDKVVSPIISPLGLSGAQWGAGMSLAAHIYRKGPKVVMNEDAVKDRHIQVSREMPSLAAPQTPSKP